MSAELWARVDAYLVESLQEPDDVLRAAVAASRRAGLPPIEVAPNQGKLLHLLARSMRAERVLEIGTLGGVSTIWLARGLGANGVVVTLEVDQRHATVARANLERAGLLDRVEVRVGPAAETLRTMIENDEGRFDLVFIDADKEGSASYLEAALTLTRAGSLIVVDNVVRHGAVADPATRDSSALGIRALFERLRDDRRLEATALQTVGSKGYDGILIGLVVEPA